MSQWWSGFTVGFVAFPNDQIGERFDRELFFALGGWPVTTEEMAMSLVRSEKWNKQYRKWWFAMADKYGTGLGGGLNWGDPFTPTE